jgi:uncharacterized protein DUF1629
VEFALVYQLDLALEPGACYGTPNKSPARLAWFRNFQDKHRLGTIEDWMREYFPTAVIVDPGEGALHDVVGTHLGYCVSERTKALIEELEPKRHQFLPVELFYGATRRRYFILRIGETGDYYDLDKSDVAWDRLEVAERQIKFWHKKIGPLSFSLEKTRGKHLFQNYSGTRMTLISDELYEMFQANNITGIRCQRQHDV